MFNLSENILDISTLSKWDKLKLDCAIISQYHDTYNCFKCVNSNRDPQSLKELQKIKGCFTKQDSVRMVLDTGTKIYMCPGRMYGQNEIDLIKEYRIFDKTGQLPKPGGLYFQCSKTMEAFSFIEHEITKNESQKNKEEAEKIKKQSRK